MLGQCRVILSWIISKCMYQGGVYCNQWAYDWTLFQPRRWPLSAGEIHHLQCWCCNAGVAGVDDCINDDCVDDCIINQSSLVYWQKIYFLGIVNVLMTTPLWVVNTRLKLQGATFRTKGLENNKTKKYKGIVGECILICR